jgi:hypothetical protein
MTEIKITQCDICGVRRENGRGFCSDVVLTIPLINSYGNDRVTEFKHLCNDCRIKLIDAIEGVMGKERSKGE